MRARLIETADVARLTDVFLRLRREWAPAEAWSYHAAHGYLEHLALRGPEACFAAVEEGGEFVTGVFGWSYPWIDGRRYQICELVAPLTHQGCEAVALLLDMVRSHVSDSVNVWCVAAPESPTGRILDRAGFSVVEHERLYTDGRRGTSQDAHSSRSPLLSVRLGHPIPSPKVAATSVDAVRNPSLQVRDLRSGERSRRVFESMDEAQAWLVARPRYTDVLGVFAQEVTPEESKHLKACCRPLDEEERVLEQALDRASEQEAQRRQRERQLAEVAAVAEARVVAAHAEPNRPIEVVYRFSGEIEVVDQNDDRAITEEVRAAVLAFVAERNRWIQSRGQVVGQAKVTVWPGVVPDGTAERVIHGTFVPVSSEG
ncbi:MAG: hypothetical protein JW751_09710 [Polyangiaceae bacterium]|nr:hypothetical protein [Polyangiaceae bacterium]